MNRQKYGEDKCALLLFQFEDEETQKALEDVPFDYFAEKMKREYGIDAYEVLDAE
jgi:hypothetical protein